VQRNWLESAETWTQFRWVTLGLSSGPNPSQIGLDLGWKRPRIIPFFSLNRFSLWNVTKMSYFGGSAWMWVASRVLFGWWKVREGSAHWQPEHMSMFVNSGQVNEHISPPLSLAGLPKKKVELIDISLFFWLRTFPRAVLAIEFIIIFIRWIYSSSVRVGLFW